MLCLFQIDIIYSRVPAHGAAGVGGEVGAVLHGRAPALGREGAAHPEPARARPLRHARPLCTSQYQIFFNAGNISAT